jgi:hypothetical protein
METGGAAISLYHVILSIIMTSFHQQSSEPAHDESSFGDLMPQSIEWTPLKGGGTNFKTHTLRQVGDLKMEFRTSLWTKLFCGMFVGLGLYVPIYHHAVQDIIESSVGPLGESLIALGLGAILIFGGYKLWRIISGKRTFDKSTGRFINNGREYQIASLDEVVAIQLLTERIKSSERSVGSSSKTSFTSFELNLVLHNGKRIPVIDHSALKKLREDAETLSDFLGVPVWNHP